MDSGREVSTGHGAADGDPGSRVGATLASQGKRGGRSVDHCYQELEGHVASRASGASYLPLQQGLLPLCRAMSQSPFGSREGYEDVSGPCGRSLGQRVDLMLLPPATASSPETPKSQAREGTNTWWEAALLCLLGGDKGQAQKQGKG